MKQIVQNMGSGKLSLKDVPAPLAAPGCVLIANAASVISAGTEKSTMTLAKKSLLGKARERPDQVRRVMEKVRQEGLFKTIESVREKLDEPMKMGYSSAGIVLACGRGVQEFKPGDLVASNGPHAEIVCVPKNLCARAPDGVTADRAAFAVIGSIALQGVRLSRASLGETALVVGLGLIGQIAVQILKASGCRVIATDPDESKCELALKFGADVARSSLGASAVQEATNGLGADAVIITAATQSKQPMDLAAAAVRKKGRVVLVGVVGLELDRRPWYFSEAEFVVSCSYGPGRYDPDYEERGRDYPAGHVRWTEQRNIAAVLQLMASGSLDVGPLITHRFGIDQADHAYDMIEKGSEPYLGVVLEYPDSSLARAARKITMSASRAQGRIGAGVLGAGNFARMVLLPAITGDGRFRPRIISSAGGLTAAHSGDKLGFEIAASDDSEVFTDPEVGAVFVVTRHDLHASQVVEAVRAGKHVFTEKPLALTVEEIASIEDALAAAGEKAPVLTVGFNRRFSPAAAAVKNHFRIVQGPLTISIRFNAGQIPAEHWTQNDDEGGGRIIGEACHAIDLASSIAGSPPVRVFAESVGGPGAQKVTDDQAFITLRHANGSVSSIAYLSGGDKSFPKERVEVFGGGRVAVIDDFKSVTLVSGGKSKTQKGWSQDKGHRAEVKAFADAISNGGPAPIPWEEIRAVSLASILAVQSLREGLAFDF